MNATMVVGDREPAADHHQANHGRWIDVGLDMVDAVLDHLLDHPPACDLDQTEATAGKLVAETAILLHALADDPGRRPRLTHLARRLAPHATGGAVRFGIALHPALCLDYSAGYLALRGYHRSPELDHLLTAALADPTVASRERAPHRDLEQHWLRSLLDGTPVTDDAIAATVLRGDLDVLHGTRDDTYAFTHALMYATDFGHRAWTPAHTASHTASLGEQAASALARCLDDDDFDLGGELLLTWPMLGLPLPPVATFAYELLDRAASTVGVLPSAAMSATAIAAQPAPARASYAIAVSYHSAYVMALADHLTGRAETGPAVPATPADPAVIDRLTELVGPDSARVPEWRRPADGATPPPVELLTDIALTRALARTDLPAVHQVLTTAVEAGLPITTTMRQATRLLHRVATV